MLSESVLTFFSSSAWQFKDSSHILDWLFGPFFQRHLHSLCISRAEHILLRWVTRHTVVDIFFYLMFVGVIGMCVCVMRYLTKHTWTSWISGSIHFFRGRSFVHSPHALHKSFEIYLLKFLPPFYLGFCTDNCQTKTGIDFFLVDLNLNLFPQRMLCCPHVLHHIIFSVVPGYFHDQKKCYS